MSLHTYLKDPLPVRRWVASLLARFPNESDRECFRELWELHRQVPGFSGGAKAKAAQDLKESEAVDNEFRRLKLAADRTPASTFRTMNLKLPATQWLPANGKYVIFSDHHIAPDNNRHSVFKKFHNDKLYCRILAKYFIDGYTLIENGDIEELVIFEPTLEVAKRRGRLKLPDEMGKLEGMRLVKRQAQLQDVVNSFTGEGSDPKCNFYKLIGDTFLRHGRYFRTVGNHDDDTQRAEFDAILTAAYGRPVASLDYVFIESQVNSASGPRPGFMVLHGNQFDHSTNPGIAPVSGELHSECLAWAYEGADRVWRWDTHGKEWALNGKSFNNRLVEAEPAPLPPGLERVFNSLFALADRATQTELRRELSSLRDRDVRAVIENLQGEPIAWEYLIGDTVWQKLERIFSKQEFFKYRHTDETYIWRKMNELFGSNRGLPVLVLGHTHEVRCLAIAPDGNPYSQYLNTGSAGRFENLIWAVEIDNGQARVVSWSFKEFPGGDTLSKCVWRNHEDRLFPMIQQL